MAVKKIFEYEGKPVYYAEDHGKRVSAVHGPVDPNATYQGACVLNHETGRVTMMDGGEIVHPNPEMVGKTEVKAYVVGTEDRAEAEEHIKMYWESKKTNERDNASVN